MAFKLGEMEMVRVQTRTVSPRIDLSYRLGEEYRGKVGRGSTVLHNRNPLTVQAADLHYLGQLRVGLNSPEAQAHFDLIAAARAGKKSSRGH